MLSPTPRRVALLGLQAAHLDYLDAEADRLNVPRSRLLEALLDFAIECLRDGRLLLPGDEIVVDPEPPTSTPSSARRSRRQG